MWRSSVDWKHHFESLNVIGGDERLGDHSDVRSNYEEKVQMDATNNSPDNNCHFISCVHSLLNTRSLIFFL